MAKQWSDGDCKADCFLLAITLTVAFLFTCQLCEKMPKNCKVQSMGKVTKRKTLIFWKCWTLFNTVYR